MSIANVPFGNHRTSNIKQDGVPASRSTQAITRRHQRLELRVAHAVGEHRTDGDADLEPQPVPQPEEQLVADLG